jgi:hypothetical protein
LVVVTEPMQAAGTFDASSLVAPSLPEVATVARPRLSLEVVAIAAAVFAVVQSLIWFAPALLWGALIAIVAMRGALRDEGLDMVFARAKHNRRRTLPSAATAGAHVGRSPDKARPRMHTSARSRA